MKKKIDSRNLLPVEWPLYTRTENFTVANNMLRNGRSSQLSGMATILINNYPPGALCSWISRLNSLSFHVLISRNFSVWVYMLSHIWTNNWIFYDILNTFYYAYIYIYVILKEDFFLIIGCLIGTLQYYVNYLYGAKRST